MIDFDCLCRQYRFSVPDELAGDTVQCPTCRRLNDIPTESDLKEIDEFGGYKIELVDDPKALDHDLAIKAYTRGRIDEYGQQIDMRQTFDDVMRAGVPSSPIAFDGLKKTAPKYDPETGELIRPLAIKDEKPLAVIALDSPANEKPLDAIPIRPKTLEYGRARVGSTTVAMATAFIVLLRPENLVVMFFVLLAHLLVFGTGLIVMMGFIFVFVAPTVMLMSLFAHYGNVIDEIGPTDRDEIPVPLRNGSIFEDIWLPFTQVIMSLFLAFFPLICVHGSPLPIAARSVAEILSLLLGCAAGPVLLLTIVTSGAYNNLRPDRLMSVIRICGFQYLIVVSTFAAGMVVYILALVTISAGAGALVSTTGIWMGLTGVGSGTLILALAIYLTHAAAWQIGLLYRAHQPEFPWVLQRHTYTKAAERNRPSSPGALPRPAKPAQNAGAAKNQIAT